MHKVAALQPAARGARREAGSLTRLRSITSVMMPDVSRLRNAEHRELVLPGVRLAMGEPE
jgi:hypothetical protein